MLEKLTTLLTPDSSLLTPDSSLPAPEPSYERAYRAAEVAGGPFSGVGMSGNNMAQSSLESDSDCLELYTELYPASAGLVV